MARLKITFSTGTDDLRNNSTLNLGVNLATGLKQFPKLVTGGIGGGGTAVREIDVDGLTDPSQLLNFTLEQLSHEDFGQTRDNWDMSNVQIVMQQGRFPAVLADGVSHRFTGDSPSISFVANQLL